MALDFLTGEYDRPFFFWELVEVMKKLILVGVLSVVAPGSIMQLAVAFVIVLCFLVALCLAQPYKEPTDDVIALAAGFGLVMFFFISLILKVQTLTEAVEGTLSGQLARYFAIDNGANAALLLIAMFAALVIACGMIVAEISAAAHATAKEQKRRS